MSHRHPLLIGLITLFCIVTISTSASAQGGSRGRGGGAGLPSGPMAPPSRLETFEADFKLTKDQKKIVKTLLDEAHKSAAAAREGLIRTHAALAAAVQANKGQAEIDAAAKSYAEQAAAMATIEMKALGDVLKTLEPEQRANKPAILSAFYLMRGAFLDSKRWDDIPDGKSY